MNEEKSLEEARDALIQQCIEEIAKVPLTPPEEFGWGLNCKKAAARQRVVNGIIEKYKVKLAELEK